MKRTLTALCLSVIAALYLSAVSLAQEPTAAPVRPRPQRPAQPPEIEPLQKSEAPPEAPISDEQMRRALVNLSTKIDSLNTEIKLLRRATERNSLTIELLLSEERLAKAEDKLDDLTQRKVDLDAREAEILRRQKNIQQELVMRGGLRREDNEAALRAEFQRALDDTHNQQQPAQQRIAEVQVQVTQLRSRVDTLRRRLERMDDRSDAQQQQQ